MMRWLYSIPDSVDMNFSKLWEIVEDLACCSSWSCRVGYNLVTEQHSMHAFSIISFSEWEILLELFCCIKERGSRSQD